MTALSNLSRKAIVGLTLLVCYLPFGWIPFLVEKQLLPHWLKLWPLLPGTMMGALCTELLGQFRVETGEELRTSLAIVFSLIIPGTLIFFLFRFPRWRWLVLGLGLSGISTLSWFAYQAYLA